MRFYITYWRAIEAMNSGDVLSAIREDDGGVMGYVLSHTSLAFERIDTKTIKKLVKERAARIRAYKAHMVTKYADELKAKEKS